MGRFRDALAAPGLGAIAEVKRRSPSAGDLRPGGNFSATLPIKTIANPHHNPKKNPPPTLSTPAGRSKTLQQAYSSG